MDDMDIPLTADASDSSFGGLYDEDVAACVCCRCRGGGGGAAFLVVAEVLVVLISTS